MSHRPISPVSVLKTTKVIDVGIAVVQRRPKAEYSIRVAQDLGQPYPLNLL